MEVNRKVKKEKCNICGKNFDESAIYKSKVYYNITKEAEESRKKGTIPYEFGLGIVNVIDQLYCSEEEKASARYDLEHNYEVRVLSYCRDCARVANFMRIGPSEWSKIEIKK
jgi:hypothetical protein